MVLPALHDFLGIVPPIVLRARYAMSGTDLAHGVIVLRACYAIGLSSLHFRYSMSGTEVRRGTELLYGAMHSAVLKQGT
eukprot:2920478-Rhodomonas_salina.1